jgi:thioredoxin 1
MIFCNLDKDAKLKDIICEKKNVIVQFSASWCGPCKQITPFMEKLGNENSDLDVIYVDVDSHGQLSQEYSVRGVPMLVFYKDGKEFGNRVNGSDTNAIKEKVEAMTGRKL